MEHTTAPAIARLVQHHNGPSALSKLLGGKPVYQEIQRWVARGWASPMHIVALEPHLPEGMTIHDLYADRTRPKEEADAESTGARPSATTSPAPAAAGQGA